MIIVNYRYANDTLNAAPYGGNEHYNTKERKMLLLRVRKNIDNDKFEFDPVYLDNDKSILWPTLGDPEQNFYIEGIDLNSVPFFLDETGPGPSELDAIIKNPDILQMRSVTYENEFIKRNDPKYGSPIPESMKPTLPTSNWILDGIIVDDTRTNNPLPGENPYLNASGTKVPGSYPNVAVWPYKPYLRYEHWDRLVVGFRTYMAKLFTPVT